MFFSPSPLKGHRICVGALPRLLMRFLFAWLALLAVTIGNATADDTIIVIPTVNSDVQSHAAVTVSPPVQKLECPEGKDWSACAGAATPDTAA